MILNTTYKNKDNTELIDELVGKPYALWERLALKGIGSKRMMIEEVSLGFTNLLNTVSDINYANIELRRGGILIMINKGLQNFTWVIPFYHLSFFKSSSNTIHADGKYIRFRKNTTFRENKKFFDKMMEHKISFESGMKEDDFYGSLH